MSWAPSHLGESLTFKQGDHPIELVTKSTAEVLANKKRLGIYFSAHWCPPCRGFTPLLAEFYNECKSEVGEDELEIVFVSSDQDKKQFREYYLHEMPWVTLPYDAAARQQLGREFRVEGIPSFVIVDPKTGRVIDHDARTTVAQANGNVKRALSKWAV